MLPGALTRALRTTPAPAIIWALPLVFIVHDIEEILTIERFEPGALSLFSLPGFPLSAAEFTVSVAFIFIACVAISYLAAKEPNHAPGMGLFAIAVIALFINTLAHVGFSVVLTGYSPGVITAVLLVLPYSVLAAYRLRMDGFLSRKDMLKSAALAVVTLLPLIILALMIGKVVGLAFFNV